MTYEVKQQILNDYNDKSIKVQDIQKKYHIAGKQLMAIVSEMGGQPRNPNMVGSHKTKTKFKTCPNCRRKIEVKGAKYCCFCGSDIREEKDLIIEKLQSVCGRIVLLPADMRDETQAIINEAIAYIRKGDSK